MMAVYQLRRLSFLPAIVLVCAALAVAGCGIFSPDTPGEDRPQPSAYKDLTDPEHVITNLQLAYNDQNYDQYDRLRHELFEFQFPADEFDLSGQANGRWDRLRDSGSTQRMFDDQPSKDGEIVQSIDLTMQPESALPWTDQVEPEFAGTLRRTYTVRMDVAVSPGATIYQVRGTHEFYVAPVQVGDKTLYKLRFWRDNGIELTKLAASSAP